MLVGEKMPGSAATLPGGGRKGGGESAYVNKYNPAYNNSSTRNNQADNSPNAAAALAYVQLPEPFAIFPVWWVRNDRRCACGNPECHNPGKHPIGKLVPNGHKDATTDPATVRRWWAQYPRANIGWALPAHIGVVDVDPRNGGEVDALPLTWAERGTLAARTGGGGVHLAYRLPGDGRVFTCGKLGDGLDFKTRGGYVVLAPSTHASGNTYQWEPGQGPRDVEILPAPPALLNILPLESRPRAVGEGFTASPVSDTLRERMTWVLSELCADFDPAVTEGMLICPFHNDTHASLSYHLGRGVFYCYGDGCEAHKRGNGVIEL